METKLSQLIAALGLKQNEFAVEIGTSPSVINQIITGNRNIGLSLMIRIKERWENIDMNWFFREEFPIFFGGEILQNTSPDRHIHTKCKRCIELERMVNDSRDTIMTLRKAIENNTILFENMNEMLKRK